MKNHNLIKVKSNDEDIEQNAKEIVALADEMAASTASLNHHTYCIFLEAREALKRKVEQLCCRVK